MAAQFNPGSVSIPTFGQDSGDFFLKAFAAPGAAIANTRDYYGQMKAEQDRAAAAAASNATEQARIAESRRQYETARTTPTYQEFTNAAGTGSEMHAIVGGKDMGVVPGTGTKPWPSVAAWNSPEAAKEFFAADQEVKSLTSMQADLKAALDLNEKTYTGWSAPIAGGGVQAIPEDAKDKAKKVAPFLAPWIDAQSQAGSATEQIDKLTSAAAVFLNSPLLKGSPSEFEAKTVLGLLRSNDPKIRGEAITRATTLIDGFVQSATARRDVFGGGGRAGPGAGAAGAGGTNPAPPPVPPPAGGDGTVPGPTKPVNTLDPASAAGLKASLAADPSPANRARLKQKLIESSVDPTPFGL